MTGLEKRMVYVFFHLGFLFDISSSLHCRKSEANDLFKRFEIGRVEKNQPKVKQRNEQRTNQFTISIFFNVFAEYLSFEYDYTLT